MTFALAVLDIKRRLPSPVSLAGCKHSTANANVYAIGKVNSVGEQTTGTATSGVPLHTGM